MLRVSVVSILLVVTTRGALALAPEAHLRELLAAESWSEGGQYCDRLPKREGERYDVAKLDNDHFAEVAALCAAVSSGAGDQDSADWWWFTATAMDLTTALGLLDGLRSQGLLLRLPPPRTPGTSSTANAGTTDEGKVTLPNGTKVQGGAVQLLERTKPPSWMRPPRAGMTRMVVEFLVDSHGTPRQPLLIFSNAPPRYRFQALWWLRGWRYSPATVDGQQVDSLFQLTVTTSHN